MPAKKKIQTKTDKKRREKQYERQRAEATMKGQQTRLRGLDELETVKLMNGETVNEQFSDE